MSSLSSSSSSPASSSSPMTTSSSSPDDLQGKVVGMKAIDMDAPSAASGNPPNFVDYAAGQAKNITEPLPESNQDSSLTQKASDKWKQAGEDMQQNREQRAANMQGIAEYPPSTSDTTISQSKPSMFDSVKQSIASAISSGQQEIDRLQGQMQQKVDSLMKSGGKTENHSAQSSYSMSQVPSADGKSVVSEEWQKKVDDNPAEVAHKETVLSP